MIPKNQKNITTQWYLKEHLESVAGYLRFIVERVSLVEDPHLCRARVVRILHQLLHTSKMRSD